MRYIILSDIHGNLQAFEAVIRSFPEGTDISVICAGDVVGYGADPDKCIERVLSLKSRNVLGNHDAAVIGKTDITFFNRYAASAVLWTKEHLSQTGRDYLSGLPFVRENELLTVVHGTLHAPEKFNYMMNAVDAMRTFEVLKTKICFIGHSHIPGVFILRDDRLVQSYQEKIKLEREARYIINVGSVGQPRDDDNRACYCIYNSHRNEVEFHRVEYDIKSAHDSIIAAGLPRILADRLWVGR